MRDIPIPLHAWEVLALLAGRKTQTRRLAWRDPHEGSPADGLERRPSSWRKVQPGDRLWVREAFYSMSGHYEVTEGPNVLYRASDEAPGRTWRPSVHMPRWASRLTLTVSDVRVQRLHEISEADAQAEGTTPFGEYRPSHISAFRSLWNHLHGFGAWDANPEVVALTFTVTKGNIDA